MQKSFDRYFSRISLNPNISNPKLISVLRKCKYHEHQVLWNLFEKDPNAKRDFLYRQFIEHKRIKYYVLSKRKPVDTSGTWNIEGPKVYKPLIKTNQKLTFLLRTSPTVFFNKQRHDIVMHAKKLIAYNKKRKDKNFVINELMEKSCDQWLNKKKDKNLTFQELIQKSCAKWLDKKAKDNGFVFKDSDLLVEGYQQHKTKKKSRHNICYSTVDFQGLLTVVDVQLFQKALIQGIGKNKAFGCGLMLIKKYNV